MKEKIIKAPKILVYDDDSLQYTVGVMGCITQKPIICETEYITGTGKSTYLESCELVMDMNNVEELNNIELDPTTMKRIAIYNKEQECKRLDKKIQEKKDKIKELDSILTDRDKRVQKLKEYIANIYDIDICDDEYDYYD